MPQDALYRDFVFGASNLEPQFPSFTRTILTVRAANPANPADKHLLEGLNGDQEVGKVMNTRSLKFAMPVGFKLARGPERACAPFAPPSNQPPPCPILKVTGTVEQQRVDAWFDIPEPVKWKTVVPNDAQVEPLTVNPEFVEFGPSGAYEIDLPRTHVQQIVLRVRPTYAPKAAYVAVIDHWAEGPLTNPNTWIPRDVANQPNAADAYRNSPHAKYIGGMVAVFIPVP